ncbi:hypothetical protein TRFO_20618 [Tritrichomonas foetus]|uniref:Uncharacterized protein n=1 Tax=Tritrichomonas foetus TaxID=1144522 RepID=A0A1J4KFE3_9EUKA|nr:hypothetical protein TRFO_20618 [Tritrichomonas foetus]|eukprot:OHT10159.1 hypothetical protein TRFO_20618 [Tritrichomonas foetus]
MFKGSDADHYECEANPFIIGGFVLLICTIISSNTRMPLFAKIIKLPFDHNETNVFQNLTYTISQNRIYFNGIINCVFSITCSAALDTLEIKLTKIHQNDFFSMNFKREIFANFTIDNNDNKNISFYILIPSAGQYNLTISMLNRVQTIEQIQIPQVTYSYTNKSKIEFQFRQADILYSCINNGKIVTFFHAPIDYTFTYENGRKIKFENRYFDNIYDYAQKSRKCKYFRDSKAIMYTSPLNEDLNPYKSLYSSLNPLANSVLKKNDKTHILFYNENEFPFSNLLQFYQQKNPNLKILGRRNCMCYKSINLYGRTSHEFTNTIAVFGGNEEKQEKIISYVYDNESKIQYDEKIIKSILCEDCSIQEVHVNDNIQKISTIIRKSKAIFVNNPDYTGFMFLLKPQSKIGILNNISVPQWTQQMANRLSMNISKI